MNAQQLSVLNALVTYSAENIPNGLRDDEREVAKLVGRWAIRGVIDGPRLTVKLQSVRVSDHEADEQAWSVILEGPGGDTTVGTWTSRKYAHCEACCLVEMLNIVLHPGSALLELP